MKYEKFLTMCIICLLLGSTAVSAFASDSTNAECSENPVAEVPEDSPNDLEVEFFRAVTSAHDASVNTHPIYLGDQLVLSIPDDWTEIDPDDSICAFTGTDEAGNRVTVVVDAMEVGGMNLSALEEAARTQPYSCMITANGRTFFTVLTRNGGLVTAWLTEDQDIISVFAFPETDQAMRSEKLVNDLHQIMCRLRPLYEGELEQLAAQKALEGKEKKGELVSFHDPEFERMVRAAMGRAADEPVYTAELETVRNLSIRSGRLAFSQEILTAVSYQQPSILDLSDLALFPNLRYLSITDMECTGYEALTGLAELNKITLIRTGLTDCGFVRGMNLVELNLAGNKLTDFSPIASLTGLRELNLFNTGLDSLDVIRGLDLTQLIVGNNPISDLEPISQMTHLKYLAIQNTDVQSLDVLRNCKELETLNIAELAGEISLEPLYGLEKLQQLIHYGTSMNDTDKEELKDIIR